MIYGTRSMAPNASIYGTGILVLLVVDVWHAVPDSD